MGSYGFPPTKIYTLPIGVLALNVLQLQPVSIAGKSETVYILDFFREHPKLSQQLSFVT